MDGNKDAKLLAAALEVKALRETILNRCGHCHAGTTAPSTHNTDCMLDYLALATPSPTASLAEKHLVIESLMEKEVAAGPYYSEDGDCAFCGEGWDEEADELSSKSEKHKAGCEWIARKDALAAIKAEKEKV